MADYVSPPAPPTRIISWLQRCTEADPDFYPKLMRPKIYFFSNGREFVRDPNVYTD